MLSSNLNAKKLVISLDGFGQGGTQQAILHLLPFMCTEFDKVYLIILQKTPFDLELPNLSNFNETFMLLYFFEITPNSFEIKLSEITKNNKLPLVTYFFN